jgi:hypothetical protein
VRKYPSRTSCIKFSLEILCLLRSPPMKVCYSTKVLRRKLVAFSCLIKGMTIAAPVHSASGHQSRDPATEHTCTEQIPYSGFRTTLFRIQTTPDVNLIPRVTEASMFEAFSTTFGIHWTSLDQFRVLRDQFTILKGYKRVPSMKL